MHLVSMNIQSSPSARATHYKALRYSLHAAFLVIHPVPSDCMVHDDKKATHWSCVVRLSKALEHTLSRHLVPFQKQTP